VDPGDRDRQSGQERLVAGRIATSIQAMIASTVTLKATRAVQRSATGSSIPSANRRSPFSTAMALKSSA
jgi:hypothetical protein